MTTSRLSLHLCSTEADRQEVVALRDCRYRERLGLQPSQWAEDEERDAAGWVFLLSDDDRPVATVRVIPMGAIRTELGDLGRLPDGCERDPWLCEVTRIAAEDRAGPELPYSAYLFGAVGVWLIDANLHRYIGYCRTTLVPFFRAVGAKQVGELFRIPGRGDTEYVLIAGQLTEVIDSVVGLGARRDHLPGLSEPVGEHQR